MSVVSVQYIHQPLRSFSSTDHHHESPGSCPSAGGRSVLKSLSLALLQYTVERYWGQSVAPPPPPFPYFFVSLLLCLLHFSLAPISPGSWAAPQQADVPTQLQQARSVVAVYVNQVRDSANKALDHLDDTEYREYK